MSALSQRELIKHFFNDDLSEEHVSLVLKTISDHVPDLLDHAYLVQKESSDTGALMVYNEVSTLIDMIVSSSRYEITGYMDKKVFTDTVSRVSLMGVAGSVIDEMGVATRKLVRDMSIRAWGIHEYIQRKSQRKPDQCREYWRGIAALTLTDRNVTEEANSSYIDFIEWVGQRGDLVEVVQLAQQRKGLNLSVVKSLYLEQLGNASAIRSGAL